VLVPAGEFVMGDAYGHADAMPCSRVRIDRPFWIGTCEVTNSQYAAYDARHDSRYIDQQWKDHTTPGYPANEPNQPVIRVSCDEAQAFCRWLSQRTGERFSLPTEAQWEYAARAGTATALPTGGTGDDFSKYANLADQSIALLAVTGVNPRPRKNAPITMDFTPREGRFNDGERVACGVGKYQPNAWGLLDMHGNVAEWTRTAMRAYPYKADGRDAADADGERVIRGGSWADRPFRATSAFRLSYPKWQKVHNVGFRVVCEAK
jgi:formylglycine-generating enzyme required for sulfatase activity